MTFTRRIWSEEGLVRRDERPSKFEDELDHRRSMNLTSDWHSSSQDVRAHIAPRFHRFGARAGAGYVFQSPWTSDDFFVFSTNRRGNSMEVGTMFLSNQSCIDKFVLIVSSLIASWRKSFTGSLCLKRASLQFPNASVVETQQYGNVGSPNQKGIYVVFVPSIHAIWRRNVPSR